MAAGTLIIAIIFFSARGFFLGLPAVIARFLGLICAYFIAFSYRSDLAAVLAAKSDGKMHPLILQIASGAILFFGTMFLVSLIVVGLLKLLAKIMPPLAGVLSKEATGGRIGGAILNGAIGAMIVLAGLWIYGLTLGKNQAPDNLQRVANRFGDTLVVVARQILTRDSNTTPQQASSLRPSQSKTDTGTAEIFSNDNPEKRLFIQQIRDAFSTDSDSASIDLPALLENDQIEELINDPAVREKAMEYIEANPQQMMEALNNPKFRELMEQMEARQ